MAAKKLVLAGNPNVGKSVFFNALTGIYVDVSNYPGTTVDISKGKYNDYEVIDTPGVYGVSSFNDEERVARDVILQADLILNVVDAVHLDRDLFLTQQLIDMGKPVIVALNMMDEVEHNGLTIDIPLMEELLGVPIIPTVAPKKKGFEALKKNLGQASTGNKIVGIKDYLAKYENTVDHASEALMILEEDEEIIAKYNVNGGTLRDKIYSQRRTRINNVIDLTLKEMALNISFKQKLSKWMLRPVTGVPILLATLIFMYFFLGDFIAQDIVGVTEELIMGTWYYEFIMSIIGPFFTEGSFFFELLIGESGLLTMVPTYVLGLLLPLVVGFYFLLALLEDSGYLPRIAALLDKTLTKIGLNGKAVIPMILGFGCVTMATITTRILGSKRERFIATMLLTLAIPCSAQLGVIVVMASSLAPQLTLAYVLTIIAVFVVVGLALNKLMPGESTDLLIDIPPLRLPRIGNVLSKTWTKSWHFLTEATPLFMIGAVLITLLQFFNILASIQNALAPIVVSLLRLPKEVTTPFIMGIIRRDFGAAGLFTLTEQGLLSPEQTVVALVVITLFVPCIAAALVLFKERGWKHAVAIWVGSFAIAFATGGLLAALLV
ncbi:ferrous iron transport protein B [Vallitalea okinawensis]|uniref:ferrous iron transport protein B n=1 Tax=Vallitalea okinawensis TaxID=2078660 RepID=UPI000CFC02A7|nr:ferrous iron transport protein B [Vallitalea okinawensis]